MQHDRYSHSTLRWAGKLAMTEISSRAMQGHAGLYVHAPVHGKQSGCETCCTACVFDTKHPGQIAARARLSALVSNFGAWYSFVTGDE